MKLVNASTGADVPQGSVSVSMSGCTAGQFQYTSLANLTLQANTAYYLVSQESSDQWYDYGTVAINLGRGGEQLDLFERR